MDVHPRTRQLVDPELPAVATLLSSFPPSPLSSAVATAGAEIEACRPIGITWWPGRSITVTYRTRVAIGQETSRWDMVATAGRIPAGALVVSDGSSEIGVWRLPHDPALPGLAPALDPATAGDLLDRLGAPGGSVRTTRLAYRPTRRAVVAVTGRSHGLFLKLLKPSRTAAIHAVHRHLVESLPVPHSLGYDPGLGVLALQAVTGRTLRHVLDDAETALPDPGSLVELPMRLPPPASNRVASSPIDRLPDLTGLLCRIVPEAGDRIDALVAGIGPETSTPAVPVHGDYYEAQVMVAGGEIVGLLDVDTYGWGRPGDDPATMLGHLALWERISPQPDRVNRLARALIGRWDSILDPVDLRRRVAAVLLTLAPGSFRVQSADWPGETLARLDLAEKWLASADQIDERSLIPASEISHSRPA